MPEIQATGFLVSIWGGYITTVNSVSRSWPTTLRGKKTNVPLCLQHYSSNKFYYVFLFGERRSKQVRYRDRGYCNKLREGYLIGFKEFSKCKWHSSPSRRRAVTIGIIIVKCHTNLIPVVCRRVQRNRGQLINQSIAYLIYHVLSGTVQWHSESTSQGSVHQRIIAVLKRVLYVGARTNEP